MSFELYTPDITGTTNETLVRPEMSAKLLTVTLYMMVYNSAN